MLLRGLLLASSEPQNPHLGDTVSIERVKQLEEALEDVLAAFITAEVMEEPLPPWVAVLSDRVEAVLMAGKTPASEETPQ